MIEQLCQIARAAGDVIMAVYQNGQPINTRQKQDNSPVTEADIQAHHIISAGLQRLTPDIPVLSEEAPQEWEERKAWQCYWLVDPLDGTKEFIKRNGEFTVNIALIEKGNPAIGVVYAPALDTLYFAADGEAWKVCAGQRERIRVQPKSPPVVVVSRSHIDNLLMAYLDNLGEHKTVNVGSSLKFCLVAEGKAQEYPRFGPTHVWDTAAGHAIAIAAGARIHDWQGKPLTYLPAESLLNPGFHVFVA